MSCGGFHSPGLSTLVAAPRPRSGGGGTVEPGLLPPGICSNLDISIDLDVPPYGWFEARFPLREAICGTASPRHLHRPPAPFRIGVERPCPARARAAIGDPGGPSFHGVEPRCDRGTGGRDGLRAAPARRGGGHSFGAGI